MRWRNCSRSISEASRSAYHNKQWATSSTGQPGGKETGQKGSHYILEGDRFSKACAELLKSGHNIAYVELLHDEETATKKRESKTKYTCPGCRLNAWAKPSAFLVCGEYGIWI